MTDPYKVLGITRNASDDEIKKAYRDMARKYHPDANVNNPNKEQAEEKFKEVQAAYQQIMYEKQHPYASSGSYSGSQGSSYQGSSGNGYGSYSYGDDFDDFWSSFFGGFGGYGGYSNSQQRAQGAQDEETIRLQAAANYLNNRHYQEALNVLNSISNQSAQWHYYYAIANNGLGNNVGALEHARKAASMDPSNSAYADLVSRLTYGNTWYQTRQNPYTTTTTSTGSWCLKLCLANLLLNLCCGGGGFCCGRPYY